MNADQPADYDFTAAQVQQVLDQCTASGGLAAGSAHAQAMADGGERI